MNLSTYINLRLPGCSILGLHYFSASVSQWKGSAGQVCLSGWRLASCLFFSIYLCHPELTHVRPLVISASRWESGETDGQMWGLRCVSHIKDSFLGSCWGGGTSGLYVLIKQPYIYTVDTHWWRPLRLCLHRDTSVLNPEKCLSSFNPCVPNFSLSASTTEGAAAAQQTCASSSSDSHQAVLRASIAYMSCALRVGIPCWKVEHFPLPFFLFKHSSRKRPGS